MTQHDNILIVPVPDDAHSFEIVDNNVVGGYCIMMLRGNPDYACKYYQLPPGPWRIVGRAKELTEGQWNEVTPDWIDHTDPPTLYPTATESGQSLLLSHGIDPESNPLILIKEK